MQGQSSLSEGAAKILSFMEGAQLTKPEEWLWAMIDSRLPGRMDFTWPHWTTITALICGGIAWWLTPPEKPLEGSPDFQRKWLGVVSVTMLTGMMVVPLLMVGGIFAVLGFVWGSWQWNVAALLLLLWAGKRTWTKLLGSVDSL